MYDADDIEVMIDVRNSASVLLESPAGVDAQSFSYDLFLSGEPTVSYDSITVSLSVGGQKGFAPLVSVFPVRLFIYFIYYFGE